MTCRILVVLATAVIISACSSGNVGKFPTAINCHDNKDPVDCIERFVNSRYSTLNKALKNYAIYVKLVAHGHEVPRLYFNQGKFLAMEQSHSTEHIVSEFSKLPQGAYLSSQDKEFIKRLVHAKENKLSKTFRLIHQQTKPLEKELKDPLSLDALQDYYFGSYSASRLLSKIGKRTTDEIARDIKASMLKHNRAELWSAYSHLNNKYIERYKTSHKVPTLERFVVRAVLMELNPKIGAPNFIVSELVSQGFLFYPFGYVSVILSSSGINAYLGDKRLDKLNELVVSSLKHVGTRDGIKAKHGA
jgi:hypothetical protein